MKEAIRVRAGRRQNRGFVLVNLSIGHGISHLYDLGLPLIISEIARASVMGLSNLQVASLFSIRQVGSSAVNLGGGPFVDMLKQQWGLILTGCMVGAAFSYAFIGASPNFGVLVIAILCVSIPGALWHLPAAAALSQRFPDRRGFAMAVHGAVPSIGNYLGPLLAGVLLSVLFWRYVLFLYTIPALIMAIFVWWSLKDVGREDGQEERRELRSQFREAGRVMKNPVVMGLVASAMLRGIGLNAVAHWTPFYLRDELGMGRIEAGFHLGLLSGMGIVSAPLLGAISDRYGRKVVLVPGFIVAATLSLVVVSTGDSFLLALVLAGMGLFSFALHQLIQASVLDLVGRGTEATALETRTETP